MYRPLTEVFDRLYPHEDLAKAFEGGVDLIKAHFAGRPVRVLDLCCGTGRGLGVFGRGFEAVDVLAVDANPSMIERARQNYPGLPSGNFLVRDLTLLEASELGQGAFDLVVMTGGSIHHFDKGQRSRLFALISSIVKPGGLLVLDVMKRAGEQACEPIKVVAKKPFEDGDAWTAVVYVAHAQADYIWQQNMVVRWKEGEEGMPSVDVDVGRLFPLTPEDATAEIGSVGFSSFPLPVDWNPSIYLAFVRTD